MRVRVRVKVSCASCHGTPNLPFRRLMAGQGGKDCASSVTSSHLAFSRLMARQSGKNCARALSCAPRRRAPATWPRRAGTSCSCRKSCPHLGEGEGEGEGEG